MLGYDLINQVATKFNISVCFPNVWIEGLVQKFTILADYCIKLLLWNRNLWLTTKTYVNKTSSLLERVIMGIGRVNM